jgi:hypothetical protein
MMPLLWVAARVGVGGGEDFGGDDAVAHRLAADRLDRPQAPGTHQAAVGEVRQDAQLDRAACPALDVGGKRLSQLGTMGRSSDLSSYRGGRRR